jgi:hypothetical protein
MAIMMAASGQAVLHRRDAIMTRARPTGHFL